MNKNLIKQLLVIFFGACLMTFAVVNFLVQHDLAIAGTTGIKVIVYQLTGMNPGLVGYMINIPLLLIFYKFYDRKTFLMTLYGMAIFNGSLFIFSEMGPIIPSMHNQMLLMSILSGAVGGLGVGLVARMEGTTGGAFIIGKLANTYLKISIARAMLIFDALVLLLSLYFFLTPVNAFWTMISLVAAAVITSNVERFGKPVLAKT